MKSTSLTTLAFLVAMGSAGCEIGDCADPGQPGENTEEVRDGNCTSFKSLKRFTGTRVVENAPYAPGKNVLVQGVNGEIEVRQGTVSNGVAVTVTPFIFRAHDTPNEEAAANMEKLIVDVRTDAAENVVVKTTRASGSHTMLGGNVIVELPIGFDGELHVHNGNGTTTVKYVGDALLLDILSENGSVTVENGGNVDALTAKSRNGRIDVRAGSVIDLELITENGRVDATVSSVSWLNIRSGNGTITAGFGAFGDGSARTEQALIGTQNGDVNLSLPAAGAFSVRATAAESVNFGSIPTACSEESAAENSKTLTCNDGGTDIRVHADEGTGKVTATVQ
jgi:hypothetical protein